MLNKKTCNGIQLSIQSVYPVNYGTCRCTVAPVAPMRRPHCTHPCRPDDAFDLVDRSRPNVENPQHTSQIGAISRNI